MIEIQYVLCQRTEIFSSLELCIAARDITVKLYFEDKCVFRI